ncbi:MAG TPA: 4a-hydroxytetrahydrobiopterin dehydratase, partial [Candidatus Methylacidiphilales bacterium]|nr:4a-hydroxytetrahydrobiopterin dehydratase [Candidatus Methylacidiphilales bacterium]
MTTPVTIPEGWTLTPEGLKKNLTFKDFTEAVAYVVLIGKKAEAANHHPDIDIRWNKVNLVLITHSKGKVTEADY